MEPRISGRHLWWADVGPGFGAGDVGINYYRLIGIFLGPSLLYLELGLGLPVLGFGRYLTLLIISSHKEAAYKN